MEWFIDSYRPYRGNRWENLGDESLYSQRYRSVMEILYSLSNPTGEKYREKYDEE